MQAPRNHLTPLQRKIFNLLTIQGPFTITEMARALGASRQGVYRAVLSMYKRRYVVEVESSKPTHGKLYNRGELPDEMNPNKVPPVPPMPNLEKRACLNDIAQALEGAENTVRRLRVRLTALRGMIEHDRLHDELMEQCTPERLNESAQKARNVQRAAGEAWESFEWIFPLWKL